MNLLSSSFLKQLIAIFLYLLLSLNCYPSLALAQSVPKDVLAVTLLHKSTLSGSSSFLSSQYSNPAFIFRIFRREPKRNDGAPTNTGSAGRRGQCHELNQSFAALVPRIGINSQDPVTNTGVGFTTQVHPTAFVLFPDLSDFFPLMESDSFSAQFMLQQLQGQDEVDVLDSAVEISMPSQTGIAAINFADLDITLNPDHAYHWYLSIICDQARPSRNPSVDAWLEVVDSDERQAIEERISVITNPLEKVKFYIEQEIWHDAVTLLTALRCQEPSNTQFKENLKELLTTLFLDNEIEIGIKNQIAEAVEIQHCPVILRVASN